MSSERISDKRGCGYKLKAVLVATLMVLSTISTIGVFLVSSVTAEDTGSETRIWTTDEFGSGKEDFSPGETVYINGEGFTPNAEITVTITRPDGSTDVSGSSPRFTNGTLYADSDGGFELYPYDLDGVTGEYTIEATDGTYTATCTFTDSYYRVYTYLDSARTNMIAVFHQNDTVYAKLAYPGYDYHYYKYIWIDPDGVSHEGPCIQGSNGGKLAEMVPSSLCLSTNTNPIGKWEVKVEEYRYSGCSGWPTATYYGKFYVVDDSKIFAKEDAPVYNIDPYKNYEDENYIHTRRIWSWYGLSSIWRSYLKFDIPSLPSGAVLKSATLCMYRCCGRSSFDPVGIYNVSGSWSESTLTWNNQPDSSELIATRNVGPSSGWYTWDVTSAVRDRYMHGDNELSIEVKMNPESGYKYQDFYSTEKIWGSYYQGPYLILEYEYCDFGDAPSQYPTLLANNGARHAIGGPWFGSSTDNPDSETDGQPDANALGDDNDGNDDENGITIPPLEIGTTNTLTIEVNNTGGYVSAWIDYNMDGDWDDTGEKIIDRMFLPEGVHNVDISVPSGLSTGETYARFRIVSDDHVVEPTGYEDDGEVEDYKVELVDTQPPTQSVEFGWPRDPDAYPDHLWRLGGKTPVWVNSTDVGTGTKFIEIYVWWDSTHTGPNQYDEVTDYYYVEDWNGSAGYTGMDTDPTPGNISVTIYIDESCYHEVDAYCEDYAGNGNWKFGDDFLVDADGPIVTKEIGLPRCGDYITPHTKIWLNATDPVVGDINCSTQCIDSINWTIERWNSSTQTWDLIGTYSYNGDSVYFTFGEECLHRVEYWAVDCLGNEGEHHTQTYHVDDTPPSSTILFDNYCEDSGKTYIKNTTLITINALDSGECAVDNAVIYYRVWANGQWTTPWMQSIPGQDVTFKLKDLGSPWDKDCKHYIEYYAVDCLGNTENIHNKTVYVDNTGPDAEIEWGNPSHVNSVGKFIRIFTPIWINATDLKPGCASGTVEIHYRINNGPWQVVNGDSYKFNFTENCTHVLEAYAVDCLGNEGEHNITTFYVDEEKPGIRTEYIPAPYDKDGRWWISNKTIKRVRSEDKGCNVGGAGVAAIEWKIFNSTDDVVSTNITHDNRNGYYEDEHVRVTGDNDPRDGIVSINITILESCNHTIWHRGIDYLDNGNDPSGWSTKQNVKVDTKPPIVKKEIGQHKWPGENDGEYYVTNQTRIWINATDNTSTDPCVVGSVHLKIGIWYKDTGWNYTWHNVTDGPINVSFTFESAGVGGECIHYVTYWAEDDVGNSIVEDNETFYVDNTPPDVKKEIGEPKYKDSLPDGDWYITKDTPIWINVTDNGTKPCIVGSTTLHYRIWYNGQWYNFPDIHSNNGINYRFTLSELAQHYNYPKLANDCVHYLEYWVEDDLGNRYPESGWHNETFYVDNTPPNVQKEIGEPKYKGDLVGADNWYITNKTRIWINATDDPSNYPCNVSSVHLKMGVFYNGQWKYWWYNVTSGSINESFTFEELAEMLHWPELANDCVHYLTYEAWDNLGNHLGKDNETFYVDNTPPDVKKEIGEPKYKGDLSEGEYYVTKNTRIWINASDNTTHSPCVVKSVHLRIGVFYNGQWKYWWKNISYGEIHESFTFAELATRFSWSELANDCVHYVTYWAEDDLGNAILEDNETFYVDNTPPNVQKEIGEPKYKGDLVGTDNWYITNKTRIWVNVTEQGTEPCVVGSTTLHYAVKYKGNWYNDTIHHEKTEGPIRFNFTFEELANHFNAPELADECVHTLKIWAEDDLRNKWPTCGWHTERFYVDNTPPDVIKIVGQPEYHDGLPPGDYYVTNETPITINVEDQGTNPCIVGSTTLHYRVWYNGIWHNFPDIHHEKVDGPINYQFTFDDLGLGDDCVHYLEYYVEDDLGNRWPECRWHNETFYVDNTPPISNKWFTGPTCDDPVYGDNYWLRDHDTWVIINTSEDYTDNNICDVGVDYLHVELWWDSNNDSVIDKRLWKKNIYDNRCNDYNGADGVIEYRFQIDEDCLHEIRWYAVDKLGNRDPENCGYYSQQHRVDSQPPLIIKTVGEPSITDDNHTWWVTTDTEINITAIDQKDPCAVGGVTLLYMIAYRTPENNTGWLPYTGNITFNEHCTHYLYIKAVDCLGNIAYDNETFIVHGEIDQVPTLQSPADGSTIYDNTPTLDWNTITGQNHYRLQYADNIDFTGATTVDVYDSSEYTIPSPLDDGIYYWHVAVVYTGDVVGQYSDTWWFDLDAHPPAIAIDPISSPVEDVLEINITTSDTDIEDVVFEYSMYTDGPWHTIGTDDTAPFSMTWDTTSVGDGYYYIKATATDDSGQTGYNISNQFEIDNGIIGVPTLLHPADGSYLSYKPILTWNPVEDANGYYIEIDDDMNFTSPLVSQIVSSTSYDTYSLSLDDNKPYYWHVATRDADGDLGQYSDTWWFMIDLTPPVISDVTCSDNDHVIVAGDTVLFTVTEENSETGLTGWIQIGDTSDYIYGLIDNWNGKYTYTWHVPEDFTPGDYTIHATLQDVFDRMDTNDSLTVTIIEPSGPITSILNVVPNPTNNNIVFEAEITSDETIIAGAEYRIDYGTPVSIPFTWLDDNSYDATYEHITSHAIDVTGLTDGEHVLYIHAMDENGNWGPWDEEEFTVDRAPPVANIVNPTAGTSTGQDITLIVITDEIATCEYKLDDGSWQTMTNTNSSVHNTSITGLSDGEHTIKVRATDALGNKYGNDSVTWTVTTTGPTTSGTDVIPDPSAAGDQIEVTATTHSTIATISDAEFYITNSTGATVLSGKMEAEDGSFDGETSEDLINNTINTTGWNPGEYTIHVRGQDSNGHWGAYDEEEFTLYVEDTVPPEFDLIAEKTGVVSGSIWYNATNFNSSECVDRVEFYIKPFGGQSIQLSTITEGYNGNYTYVLDTTEYPDGGYYVYAVAYDCAGNSYGGIGVAGTYKVPIIDNTPPSITITNPSPGSIPTVEGIFNITFTVSDAHSIVERYVVINDEEFSTSYDYYLWDSTTVNDSFYLINVKAIDEAGNVGLSSYRMIQVDNDDNSDPNIHIIYPSHGDVITVDENNRGYLKVKINVSDDKTSKENLTVNLWIPGGRRDAPTLWYTVVYNDTDGYFYANVDIYKYQNGTEITLCASAEDEAGHYQPAPCITIKIEGPVVWDQWMQNGWNMLTLPHISLCNDSIERVLSSIDNGNFDIVFYHDVVNDSWSSYEYGRSHQTLDTIEPGKTYWVHMNGTEMRFYIDKKTPPFIEIRYPINGSLINLFTQNIRGVAFDVMGIEYVKIMIEDLDSPCLPYWNGANWQPTSCWLTCDGTDVWQYLGTNSINMSGRSGHTFKITAMAMDRAGCVATTWITFVYDDQPPSITILHPVNGTTYTSLSEINGTATDNENPIANVYIHIRNNNTAKYWNGTAWVSNPVNLPCTYNTTTHIWNYTNLPTWQSNNNYTISAFATDAAGNVKSTWAWFRYQ